jgi:HPt (histidine-containing phosphotransfer) domain-containing protein
VVLTANAITGMRDMFLEMGFNDYISKPIEIVKLDEIIARWIPEEKKKRGGKSREQRAESREEGSSPSSGIYYLLSETGVDVKKGITMTGGTETGYRKVLSQFVKDLEERLPIFAAMPPELPGKPDLEFFATQAHAIKSAAGTIGAAEISAEAARLEAAGKSGDIETIRDILPGFYTRLSELIKAITEALLDSRERMEKSGQEQDSALLSTTHSLLSALRGALETKNMKEIDRIIEELEVGCGGTDLAKPVSDMADKILMGEYEDAINGIDRMIDQAR